MWSLKPSYSSNARPPLATVRQARRVSARRGPVARRCLLEALEERTLLSFSPAVNYPVGQAPQAVVTGDFNGDGRLDLAALNASDNSVSVLLGNADGTFQLARKSATGSGPRFLAVGDFNRDGKLDLVTANANDVSVLLGNGDGTFGPATAVAIGSGPRSVAVGDLNGDGKLDLVVTSSILVSTSGYYGGAGYLNYANVLLGNGNGTFAAPISYDAGGGFPDSVAVGDFNRDGKLDVVAANTDGTIGVLLGNGDGTLRPVTVLSSLLNTGSGLAVGDLNGDGKLDLVTANPGNGVLSVILGNGDGTFQTAQSIASGANLVAIGDLNKDGKPDLVVNTSGGVNVLLGNGNGTFGPALAFATGVTPNSVAVGDFNGDGFPDLALSNGWPSNTVSVLLNAKDWSATPQASSFAISGFPSSITAGVVGSFTVTVKSASGATVTTYTGTVHFTSSDGQAVLPADYTFTAADAGAHTFSNGVILKTAGTQTITVKDATMASLTGTDGGITVNPAAASKFLISAPASVTAGVAFSLTVTVTDAYGNVVTGYVGTIHFKSTDGTATLPANYTFTATVRGVHTFTGLVLRKKGNQTITITDTLNSALTGSVIENVL